MNRKLFLNRYVPTYQQDPSFYAERVVGTVPNVFKRTYTSNQTEQVQGQFTGVDISVNVQSVPQCDRIQVGSTTKLLSEFSIGNGSSVSIPANSTIVAVTSYSDYKTINVICRSSSYASFNVPNGVRYYVFPSISYAVLISGSVVLISVYDAAGYTDLYGGSVDVYNTLMTFTV